MGYLNHAGKFVVPPTLNWAGSISDGVGWVQTVADSKSVPPKTSAVDRSGRFLFSTTLRAEDFHCGLARVHQGNLSGFIDKTGTVAIPIKYAFADDFENNKAKVATPDWTWSAINTAGEQVPDYPTGRGQKVEKPIQPYGTVIVDESGRKVYKPVGGMIDHQRYGQFSEGLCHVTLNSEKSGERREAFMNESGEIMLTLPIEMEACSDFHDGRASVVMEHKDDEYHRSGGCVGFIDHSGTVVIPAIYELPQRWRHYNPVEVVAFHDGICRVRKMGVDYYIDTRGTSIARFQGGSCSDFAEGLAPVQVRVDAQGEPINYFDVSHGFQNRFDYESALCKLLSERLKDIRLDKPVTIQFHEQFGASDPNVTADDTVPAATLSQIRSIVKSLELPERGILMEEMIDFDVFLQNGSVTCAQFHTHYR
jgi:hypothetical protein